MAARAPSLYTWRQREATLSWRGAPRDPHEALEEILRAELGGNGRCVLADQRLPHDHVPLAERGPPADVFAVRLQGDDGAFEITPCECSGCVAARKCRCSACLAAARFAQSARKSTGKRTDAQIATESWFARARTNLGRHGEARLRESKVSAAFVCQCAGVEWQWSNAVHSLVEEYRSSTNDVYVNDERRRAIDLADHLNENRRLRGYAVPALWGHTWKPKHAARLLAADTRAERDEIYPLPSMRATPYSAWKSAIQRYQRQFR